MILRFLSWLFPQVRKLVADEDMLRRADAAWAAADADLDRNLQLMTEARTNADRLNEYLRGQIEAQREQHAQEIDGLKRMIDFLSPSVGGRTVFGLAPERKPELEPKVEAVGALNRRTSNRMALDSFYREALERMHPNPNDDPPADFSQQQPQ